MLTLHAELGVFLLTLLAKLGQQSYREGVRRQCKSLSLRHSAPHFCHGARRHSQVTPGQEVGQPPPLQRANFGPQGRRRHSACARAKAQRRVRPCALAGLLHALHPRNAGRRAPARTRTASPAPEPRPQGPRRQGIHAARGPRPRSLRRAPPRPPHPGAPQREAPPPAASTPPAQRPPHPGAMQREAPPPAASTPPAQRTSNDAQRRQASGEARAALQASGEARAALQAQDEARAARGARARAHGPSASATLALSAAQVALASPSSMSVPGL